MGIKETNHIFLYNTVKVQFFLFLKKTRFFNFTKSSNLVCVKKHLKNLSQNLRLISITTPRQTQSILLSIFQREQAVLKHIFLWNQFWSALMFRKALSVFFEGAIILICWLMAADLCGYHSKVLWLLISLAAVYFLCFFIWIDIAVIKILARFFGLIVKICDYQHMRLLRM